MNVSTITPTPAKKRRWTRWGWWSFVILNVAGLFLIIPLLKVVFPLIGIWWDTHSQENFQKHQQRVAQSEKVTPLTNTNIQIVTSTPTTNDTSLESLTNQLKSINQLSDTELNKIVAWKFGNKKLRQSNPREFDDNSAVFDKITSGMVTMHGQDYYGYEIDLVDQNGNHKVSVEIFTEPNLDYERSKATMDLVNRTPQLKKIYNAFAHVLAEQSMVDTNAASSDPAIEPVLLIEKQSVQAAP